MHLVKKYTGTAMDRLLLDLMVQGVFEGANTPDFRDAVVLHRITKVPLPDSNWVRVNCPSEFPIVVLQRRCFSMRTVN